MRKKDVYMVCYEWIKKKEMEAGIKTSDGSGCCYSGYLYTYTVSDDSDG